MVKLSSGQAEDQQGMLHLHCSHLLTLPRSRIRASSASLKVSISIFSRKPTARMQQAELPAADAVLQCTYVPPMDAQADRLIGWTARELQSRAEIMTDGQYKKLKKSLVWAASPASFCLRPSAKPWRPRAGALVVSFCYIVARFHPSVGFERCPTLLHLWIKCVN